MPRVGDVFQLLSGTLAVPNTTIQSAPYNAQQNDWVTEANSARPISAGGTGETTASEARESLGAIGVGDLAGAPTKAAVVDTDSVVIIDSEAANVNKRWLVSDLETHLLTLNPPTAQARNRLINGGMQISQEVGSGTPSTANGSYPVDQWRISTTGLTGVVGATQLFGPTFPSYLHIQPTIDQPTVTSGNWFIAQNVEGNRTQDFDWGLSTGKPVVLRFYVNASTAGAYGFFIRNSPATHTYANTFTITLDDVGSWVEKIFAIPAPPVGSSWSTLNTTGITVGFTMVAVAANLAATPGWSASGTTYGVTGQLNLITSTARNCDFSGVGLYLDPIGTGAPPKWEMPDEAEELRACQRYYQRHADPHNAYFYANAVSSSWYAQSYVLPVMMRATPNITTPIARSYHNCVFDDQSVTTDSYQLRVTTTVASTYRAYGAVVALNARL